MIISVARTQETLPLMAKRTARLTGNRSDLSFSDPTMEDITAMLKDNMQEMASSGRTPWNVKFNDSFTTVLTYGDDKYLEADPSIIRVDNVNYSAVIVVIKKIENVDHSVFYDVEQDIYLTEAATFWRVVYNVAINVWPIEAIDAVVYGTALEYVETYEQDSVLIRGLERRSSMASRKFMALSTNQANINIKREAP